MHRILVYRVLTSTLLACALAAAGSSFAQTAKTTRIVVAFPPGGPVDFVARVIAEPLGKELGHAVLVENKPGANGGIGADYTIKAAPDGTTLWLSSVGAVAINPALYDKLAYDPQRDLAPVSLVVRNVEVFVVNRADPASTAAEFVAATRQKSSPTPIASSGVGSIPHLAMELMADAGKAKVLHVPYKGAAPAITDVIAGQVAGFFGDIPGLIGHIRGGRVKAIGIAAPARHPLLPEVRTFTELGIPGMDSDNWYALFVSAKTPSAEVERISQAVRRVLALEAVRGKLTASGAEPEGSTPAGLAALLAADTAKWARVIREKNIKGE